MDFDEIFGNDEWVGKAIVGTRTVAKLLKTFYDSLVDEGFTEAAAMQVVLMMEKSMIDIGPELLKVTLEANPPEK